MDGGAAERLVKKDLDGSTGLGKPISSRARLSQRTIESYLKAGVKPRWMERISEIDSAITHQKRRFERAHRNLRAECDGDPALFAQRWTEFAQRARFDELNELIQQHNDWYPIERDLPMDLPWTSIIAEGTASAREFGRSRWRPVAGKHSS